MKKIVIVGGGVAGLSAGIFAQINGFESVILEKHTEVGGQCTGWNRGGYHIDGCIHWLVGTRDETPMNDLWRTLGALGEVEIHHPETFLTFEYEGESIHLYRDLDRLQRSWTELSPEDGETITELCDDIRRLQSFEIPTEKPEDMMGIIERIRSMLSMKDAGVIMQKYGKISLRDYAQRFKHPAIRESLASFLPEGHSASSIFFALSAFTKGQASVPLGGSRALALRMASRYLSLGGDIRTGCAVRELITDGGSVVGARDSRGEIHRGDYFVGACDAHFFYHELLGGRYTDKRFESRFEDPTNYPLASQVLVALGLEGALDDLPRSISFPVEPLRLLGEPVERLNVTHFSHEPDFAPAGHTLLTCAINQFHDDYEAWRELSTDRSAYEEEKWRIGEEVKRALIARFPRMADGIEVLDVASPMTYERYCNAYRGAFMAFLPTTDSKAMAHPGTIAGLDNTFLTGQWLQPPGGLPPAAITGKHTIYRICGAEGLDFKSA